MSGELSNMYKNSFMKLEGAERAGKDTVQVSREIHKSKSVPLDKLKMI